MIESKSINDSFGKPFPVIVSQLVGAGQVWLQLTDESFRWINGPSNRDLHERYWLQLIRQLAGRKQIESSEDLGALEVAGEQFSVDDTISITLRLPKLSTQTTAKVDIVDDSGKAFTELLVESGAEGELQGKVSGLPPGQYSINLSPETDLDFELRDPHPNFIEVRMNTAEYSQTFAAVSDMKLASEISGGKLLSPQQAKRLLEELPLGRRVKMRELPSDPIWNHWIVAFCFIALLSTDWIIRRKWGLP